jgi:hypothetical protein
VNFFKHPALQLQNSFGAENKTYTVGPQLDEEGSPKRVQQVRTAVDEGELMSQRVHPQLISSDLYRDVG